ncbi:hypothetical protein V1505DRAFT_253366 [Lipomyces doorenjongii]
MYHLVLIQLVNVALISIPDSIATMTETAHTGETADTGPDEAAQIPITATAAGSVTLYRILQDAGACCMIRARMTIVAKPFMTTNEAFLLAV